MLFFSSLKSFVLNIHMKVFEHQFAVLPFKSVNKILELVLESRDNSSSPEIHFKAKIYRVLVYFWAL